MHRILFMKAIKTMFIPGKEHAVADFSRSLYRQIQSVADELPASCATDEPSQKGAVLYPGRNLPELVFVCIGTDLVPGDCLGPLVGYRLAQQNLPGICVYGTLQDPIHALNLNRRLYEIKKKHPGSCIIAIDASFGSRRYLGSVFIQAGPLYPGLGVEKSLPPVGHISVTGIVCTHGPNRDERLLHTPFSIFIPQADLIADGIIQTLSLSDKPLLRPDRIFPGVSLPDRILRTHHSHRFS